MDDVTNLIGVSGLRVHQEQLSWYLVGELSKKRVFA